MSPTTTREASTYGKAAPEEIGLDGSRSVNNTTAVATPIRESGPKAKLREVDVDKLQVDERYQRPTSEARVDSMARNYSEDLANVIVVSERASGQLYIVDGAHRALAAKQAGRRKIMAQVHTGLTSKQESEMFDKLNDARSGVDALSRFRAKVFYGDPIAIAVKSSVEARGGVIQESRSGKGSRAGVRAVQQLQKIVRHGGDELLDRVLDVINYSWEALDASTTEARVTGGIELLFALHSDPDNGPVVDENRLVDVLSEVGLATLNRLCHTNAQMYGGYGAKNFYRAILEVYNKKLGNKQRLGHIVGAGEKR